MSKDEYEGIQRRLRQKFANAHLDIGLSRNRLEGYERGLNTAMSIIKEIYEKEGNTK